MPAKPTGDLTNLEDIRPCGEFVVCNPAYSAYLRRCGLSDARAFDSLTGEVISGHADRHVVATAIGRRRFILKREHRVRWKTRIGNWLAGFRMSSLAQREATILDSLVRAGVPVPGWMAFGESRGRAFLLLKREHGQDLRSVLFRQLPAHLRRRIAQNIGCAIARVLQAGFNAPDMSAKHILVRRDRSVVLLDWPRAKRLSTITIGDCVAALARLHASIAHQLVSIRERLVVVRACLGQLGMSDPAAQVGRLIETQAERIRDKRSVAEQWQRPSCNAGERLRWMDGERLCVTRKLWRVLNGNMPFWLKDAARLAPRRQRLNCVEIPGLGRGWLSQTPPAAKWRMGLGQLIHRPVRSPSISQAGLIFRLRRYGVPVSRVLAFGGRPDGGGFILTKDHKDCQSLRNWLVHLRPGRNRILRSVGRVLRRFHEAGCAGIDGELFALTNDMMPRVRLHVDFSWRKRRTITTREAGNELRAVASDLGLFTRQEKVLLVQGYVGNEPLRHKHLQLASDVLQLSIRRAA